MSRSVFIIAPSGAGKTTSIRTLNPNETFLVNCLNKELPWRGSAKQYTPIKLKGTRPNMEWESGNMFVTSSAQAILSYMDFVNTKMPHITNFVIDDNTFVTALELQKRSGETDWKKFNDIAQNFIDIAFKSKALRDNLTVFILHHTVQEGDGILEDKKFRAMSYGKLIDEKLGSQEAQFSLVLRAAKEINNDKIEYVFYTRDANSTAKTPDGMFDSDKIPNDLQLVKDVMNCYYSDDCMDNKK
jgi:hypothetical protein